MYRLIGRCSIAGLLAWGSAAAASSIENFEVWTPIADPPNAGMTAVVDSPTQTTLTAVGEILAGTDVGLASVDGSDVADSTGGYYFSPLDDFAVAVDFDLTFLASVGAGGIGLGVGEGIDGANSAGVALAFENETPALFSAFARTLNVDQSAMPFINTPVTSGRLFVEYDSITGSVILGVNELKDSAAPAIATNSYTGIQNDWSGEGLLVSFFLRSDAGFITPGLVSGEVEAVFSNFEVLEGAPIQAPEPGALLLAAFGFLAISRHARG